jgi:hypothetical protein
MMMRVRIEADGTLLGTKVFNAETGEDISNDVCRVRFDHAAGGVPEITLTFRSPFPWTDDKPCMRVTALGATVDPALKEAEE